MFDMYATRAFVIDARWSGCKEDGGCGEQKPKENFKAYGDSMWSNKCLQCLSEAAEALKLKLCKEENGGCGERKAKEGGFKHYGGRKYSNKCLDCLAKTTCMHSTCPC